MKFTDIPGHDEAKQRLKAMVASGRTPHAMLIDGPTGIGKMALARAVAQLMHCEHPTPDGEPCGLCTSCRQHEGFNHIDTYHIFPVVKSKNASAPPIAEDYMDEWRKYSSSTLYIAPGDWARTFSKDNSVPTYYVPQATELIRRLALAPRTSPFKIVIFWQPEAMPVAVANKLLKLIEEPIADTRFIFVSERSADILPTIYSRLQRIALRRLPDEVVAAVIAAEHPEAAPESVAALAHIAEGNVIEGRRLVEQSTTRSENFDRFTSLMRLAYMRKVSELRDWANQLADQGRDREIRFYQYAIRMMRENFVFTLNVPSLTYLSVTEQQFSSRFARFITEKNVEPLIALFERAIEHISANGNGKMVNFDVALRVIILIKNA